MPDYGHELEFGYFLLPDANDPSGTLEIARLVDDLDYDLIGIQDHPYVETHLDAFSLMATVLAQTQRVRVFPDVTNLQMRSPALVAKAAASMDQLSGGRFELGLGTGARPYHDRAVAMGAPPLVPGEAVDALRESIGVIRALWTGQPDARVEGQHHSLTGAQGGPTPAHEMQIWVGASGPRMLRLIGRAADGWVIPLMRYMTPRQAAGNSLIIDEGARAAGRDPSEIRRIYNCTGEFTESAQASASDDDRKISGPVDHWIDVITHQVLDFGFSTFILFGPTDRHYLETFIEKVAPGVRERVSDHRGS